jgi:hypothetical protein
MDTIWSLRRTRRALLPMLALAAAVVCVGAAAAASAPPSSAIQKLASCMKAKGFSVPPTQAQRTSAKYQAAHRTCAKQAGLTGQGANPNRQKFISCMAKHGITISPTKRPDRSTAAYKKANAACASSRTAKA